MIENHLAENLRNLIEGAVKDFRLPVKNGEPRAPKVFNGYLPPKRSGGDDDFPFVLVRADKGSTNEDSTETKLTIIIGCYTEEFDGHEYCLNIMQRVRMALATLPCGVLGGKHILQFPISWENFEEQPYPQWFIEMETTWKTNTPFASFEEA
jgi:hypothetical protein